MIRRKFMATTIIELPEDLQTQAEALARSTGRSLAEVLTEAVGQGLAYERWFREQVQEALHSTETGRFAPPEAVEAMWQRLTTPESMAQAEAELGGLGPA
jgi:predicted transcriptional regulator